ncbi:urea transporter [Flavobacteriaceae bacterium CRH]|nr:urea transporter [Flavobacteriaceae bacterium CRH]
MNLNNKNILTPYLKGVGQIMLQNNQWTGLLFLAGIFYDSIISGIAAVLAVIVGTLTAKILKYDEDEINMGLYGFSATLVGVALVFYFDATPLIWGAIVIGASLATIIQHFFISKKIPAFTFPFIVVTWVCLYFFKNHLNFLPAVHETVKDVLVSDGFTLTTHGFGEVIFQGSVLAGILFFIAVFIASPVAALYGLLGSVLSATLAYYFHEPTQDVQMGIFSFNAVLCAITFSGIKKIDGLYVLLSVALSVFIEILMITYNYSVLTFPFVAASWIVLCIQKVIPEKLK